MIPYEIIQKVRFLSNKEIYLENEWINIIDSYSYTDEIDGFAKDPVVEGLIIDLGSVRAGYSMKQEIYNTLTNFKRFT